MGDIVDVPGVLVGHWNHPDEPTGCTVVVLPADNETGVEVRGAAPGSRETDLLRPGMTVRRADAVLLTGGSAFGLAAADGVVAELEADGRGHPTPSGPVPIVPAAVIFDLFGRDPAIRPDAAAGAAAYRAAGDRATTDPRSGAGAGATAAKWRGPAATVAAGLGSASRRWGEVTVGALVVLNPLGDVYTLAGEPLTAGPLDAEPPFWVGGGEPPVGNTTLVMVATNGAGSVDRMALRAHDALAATVRPVHTGHDGDVVFASRVGPGVAVDPDHLNELVFHAVADAVAAVFGIR